jgi:two-component system, NtrC family, response regulator GlrR
LTKARILLVDDDPGLLELLSIRLEAAGYEVSCAQSGSRALSGLDIEVPDLVIVDLRMEGMDGMSLFERLHRDWPALPVIILTAYGSIRDAVLATQKGVFSFLTKPVAPTELLTTIERALAVRSPVAQAEPDWARPIITRSAKMYQLLDQVRMVARSDVNVLIRGESGTGKELLAQAIHQGSRRAQGPFTAVNCGAIPETLLESELFGHRKGAFTGASRDHAGLFIASNGGTVFLDEIGDMPMVLQTKLLRVLQERKVRPVGDTTDRAVDVRVLSATLRDLPAAVQDGTFREDLFYRLNVVEFTLPSLRDRREDIPLLATHFLREFAEREGATATQLSPEAMTELLNFHWPGNIRQLKNVIEQVVALSPGPVISEGQVRSALPRGREAGISVLSEAKKQFERDYLVRLLKITGGNIAEAAKLAGRNRADLYKVLNRHGIKLESCKDASGTRAGKSAAKGSEESTGK